MFFIILIALCEKFTQRLVTCMKTSKMSEESGSSGLMIMWMLVSLFVTLMGWYCVVERLFPFFKISVYSLGGCSRAGFAGDGIQRYDSRQLAPGFRGLFYKLYILIKVSQDETNVLTCKRSREFNDHI